MSYSSTVTIPSAATMTPKRGYDIAELDNLEAPTLFANGGPTDVAYPTSRINFDLAGALRARGVQDR